MLVCLCVCVAIEKLELDTPFAVLSNFGTYSKT